MGQDNSHSWVRISYGTNKYVIDPNHNNTDIPADPLEDQTSQTSVKVIAASSKAKAKTQKREPVDTPTVIPMHERKWIDIDPSAQSLTAHEVSKKVISLLRHNQTVQRKEDGAIQFWRIKFIFEINSHKCSIGLMSVGNLVCQQDEVQKGDIGIALIIRNKSFTSRALQGHSGHNLIDPT